MSASKPIMKQFPHHNHCLYLGGHLNGLHRGVKRLFLAVEYANPLSSRKALL